MLSCVSMAAPVTDGRATSGLGLELANRRRAGGPLDRSPPFKHLGAYPEHDDDSPCNRARRLLRSSRGWRDAEVVPPPPSRSPPQVESIVRARSRPLLRRRSWAAEDSSSCPTAWSPSRPSSRRAPESSQGMWPRAPPRPAGRPRDAGTSTSARRPVKRLARAGRRRVLGGVLTTTRRLWGQSEGRARGGAQPIH